MVNHMVTIIAIEELHVQRQIVAEVAIKMLITIIRS